MSFGGRPKINVWNQEFNRIKDPNKSNLFVDLIFIFNIVLDFYLIINLSFLYLYL